jgi:Spy/CpxP family protein refolding chaperone
MRKVEVVGGLMLALAMTVPASAQAPEIVPAAQIEPAAQGEGIQTVQYRPGGPQRQIGQGQRPRHGRQGKFGHRRHRRPTFAGLALRYRQELDLSTQQVDSLREIGVGARHAAIRRGADRKMATLDLMALRMGDKVDMGKVEAKVREIEKLRGDGQIARIRANEQAQAQLTAEQRDKLKGLMAERWKAMRERMQQGRPDTR